MKWFDSLFSAKKSPTSLQRDADVAKNSSHKSYRDIRKRNPILSLVQGVFDPRKSYTPFSLRKHIHEFSETWPQYLKSLTHKHWFLVLLLLILAYVVYGVGFIIRTEVHMETLRDAPGSIFTYEWFSRLRSMRRDFQVLAPIIRNPIIPIEPFATYGKALDYSYNLVAELDTLRDIEWDVMYWKQHANTMSIFPVMDDFFDWMEDMRWQISGLREIVQSENMGMDISGFFSLWENFIRNKDIWYFIAGKDRPTRILLLNQNSDELRAGWGFPGTAFIIEFDAGKMTRFEFKDIYALDWHLRGYRPSPEGINQFRSLDYPGKSLEFEIRDANYYPRFHDSAVKLNELAEEAKIGKLDLVIGINQKFLEDLVHLVEPIKISGIPVTIDHRNAGLVLSMLVEGKKTLENTPKWTVKILADALLVELQKQGKIQEAATLLASHIYHGEFIAGSPRTDIQSALDSLGIFDRWEDMKGDWVYPIFTSISRNKSDRLMERTFEINHVNACERTLVLRQKHWFDLIEAARIRNLAHELGLDAKIPTLLPVQWGGDNVQYLRFILPPGTKLLPKSDPDFSLQVTEAKEFTTIHGYETTSPGTTKSMSIRYLLPEGYCDDRTKFFKQPGLRNTRVVIQKNGTTVYQKFYE